jgi:hypothetical protein
MTMRILLLACTAFAVLAVTACGDDPAAPRNLGVEPEILNETDVFQFQVSSVDAYTGTLIYNWDNTGAEANVDQSCAIEPGQATLILLDSEGAEVYSRDLSEDGSIASATGVAGSWRVRLEFTGLTGTVNFRAEKRTP